MFFAIVLLFLLLLVAGVVAGIFVALFSSSKSSRGERLGVSEHTNPAEPLFSTEPMDRADGQRQVAVGTDANRAGMIANRLRSTGLVCDLASEPGAGGRALVQYLVYDPADELAVQQALETS